MSSAYKGYVKNTSIYFKYSAFDTVRMGIMGRLGKIFCIRLNFFRVQK